MLLSEEYRVLTASISIGDKHPKAEVRKHSLLIMPFLNGREGNLYCMIQILGNDLSPIQPRWYVLVP